MKKLILTLTIISITAFVFAGNNPKKANPPTVQTIDSQDSIVFDCSQLTGVTGNIQIPVSIISDDTIYAVDFSLKYDHSALQYDTTIDVTTYLSALSYYNPNDSTIRFTSSTFTPCALDTTIALVKFILLSPAFVSSNLYTFKGYLNGQTCSIKYIPPSPVGLTENEVINFNVYPNPASDVVTINFKNATTLHVVNLVGQTVYTENVEGLNTKNINTGTFVNGIYFVKLVTNNAEGIQKLIVAH